MDCWILHALLVAGLVIHGSHAGDPPVDDEDSNADYSGDNSGDNSNEIESSDTTSVINLTTILTTSLQATPPKHSPTPNLSPGGRSHTGWLLLALGIVLLLCTALLVSTIMLASQVWKLHDQLSSVFPAQPLHVNADMIRAGKASEVMGIEMKKMMEEAKDMAEKTVGEEADAQETEVAVVPTAPPADPSSDCVLNV